MKFDGDKGPKKFQVLIQVVALGGAYVAGESLRDWWKVFLINDPAVLLFYDL